MNQQMILTFPNVPKDQQFSLMTKLHTLMSETADTTGTTGSLIIKDAQE